MGERLDRAARDRIAERAMNAAQGLAEGRLAPDAAFGTHGLHDDGTPRDWFALDIRRADFGTLLQCAELWHCSLENALGVLCRAVRVQVWPLGDVLTNEPEFQSWVERIVHAEQAPLRRAVRIETAWEPDDAA